MTDRQAPLRIAVPGVEACRSLARAWLSDPAVVASVEVMTLHDAEAALRGGRVDVAFLPTLSVLRDPEFFSVVPGVALVGRAYEAVRLHLPAGLAQVAPGARPAIGLDPRMAQEALLAQILLKEAYHAQPQFVPVPEGGSNPLAEAYLLNADAPLPDGGATLDLGREWFELTTRPMVWALLVAVADGIEPREAAVLGHRAAELEVHVLEPSVEEPASVTLARYAFAGLETWMHQLFYHRAIEDLVELPFVAAGDEDDDEA